MGIGFAALVDPQNGIEVPVVSNFYIILGTLVFLGLDGHLVVIELLAASFVTLPLALQGLGPDALWSLDRRGRLGVCRGDFDGIAGGGGIVDGEHRLWRDEPCRTSAEYFRGGISRHHAVRIRGDAAYPTRHSRHVGRVIRSQLLGDSNCQRGCPLMAEEQRNDAQERTEPATPKRLQQAREKGQVARSRELSTTALLLASAAGFTFSGQGMLEGLTDVMRASFVVSGPELLYGASPLAALVEPPCAHCVAWCHFWCWCWRPRLSHRWR